MSNDYAEIIRHNFGGHVGIIIGTSFGGMIAQHFAADHPELFDHIVIAIAAHWMSDIGQQFDNLRHCGCVLPQRIHIVL